MKIEPAQRLSGQADIPGDKSISHRFAILGAMAAGCTRVSNYSTSADCQSTLNCLAELGAAIVRQGTEVEISSQGWRTLRPPRTELPADNSGTTIRLLSGLLAGCNFRARIGGDASLSRRPMARIIEPLTQMGASIEARDGQFPPLLIQGTSLNPIRYQPSVASAQVKSCVLIAGLTAQGRTTVVEKMGTRDHTERALPAFGISPQIDGEEISVTGPATLKPAELSVPGDLSSAAFLIVAALLLPGSRVTIRRVGVNPTRSAFLDVLIESGGGIHSDERPSAGSEPVCDLMIEGGRRDFLSGFPAEIGGSLIPNLIDEIPILAVLGTRLEKGLLVRDAAELRRKETDRIRATVQNLRAVGVNADEREDGFFVPPTATVRGGKIQAFGDHRIAMAFAVLGLISREGVTIDDPFCADVSFPGFFEVLSRLRR